MTQPIAAMSESADRATVFNRSEHAQATTGSLALPVLDDDLLQRLMRKRLSRDVAPDTNSTRLLGN
jgi:hypothetical protein